MKKITFLLIIGFLSLVGNKVSAASYGNGNLTNILTNCADNEVIVLTGTSYTFPTRIATFTKGFTLIADPSLTTRPIVTLSAPMIIYTGSQLRTITFDGIDFNGNNVATYIIQAQPVSGGDLKININNCYFHEFTTAAILFTYTAATGNTTNPYSDLTITNSRFITFQYMMTTTSVAATPNNITLRNCVFTNTGSTIFLTTVGTTNKVTVDHCTFNTCVTSSRKEFAIASTTPCLITNNVFANSVATANNIVTANALSINNK